MVNNQMKELMDLLKQMDSTVKSIRQMNENDCKGVGFHVEIIDDLARFTKEQVEAFTSSVLMNVYERYKINPPARKEKESDEDYTKRISSLKLYEYPEGYDEKVTKIKENILDLYDSAVSYKDLSLQRDELASDVQKALDDYAAFLSSDEMKEKEAQQIRDLKDRIESSTDEVEKKTLMNRLKILDDSETLEFFFERINSLKDKELDSIMNTFFDKKRSEYIISRYTDKMRQMKYNPDIYQSLLDIEVNFLGKEYYAFNNIFLFAMERYIAYMNVSSEKDFLFAQTLITKVSKLVFNKLTDEQKEYMINMIKRFDDQFKDKEDIFVERNKTSPLSSFRIDIENQKKAKTLKNIENWFHDYDINLPEWYSYEEKVEYMKVMQEKVALKSWLDMYEIKYPEDASSEDLREIKEEYDATTKKHEEEKAASEKSDDEMAEETQPESEKEISDF